VTIKNAPTPLSKPSRKSFSARRKSTPLPQRTPVDEDEREGRSPHGSPVAVTPVRRSNRLRYALL
jgi:hypothetical protein